jgi:hypothetical protein
MANSKEKRITIRTRDFKKRPLPPPKNLLQMVQKATGSGLLKKKIIEGEMNEVYDVTTSDKQNVIVRISGGNIQF